jgi:hypothetical protein
MDAAGRRRLRRQLIGSVCGVYAISEAVSSESQRQTQGPVQPDRMELSAGVVHRADDGADYPDVSVANENLREPNGEPTPTGTGRRQATPSDFRCGQSRRQATQGDIRRRSKSAS